MAEEAERKRLEPESTTLLSGLFGWLGTERSQLKRFDRAAARRVQLRERRLRCGRVCRGRWWMHLLSRHSVLLPAAAAPFAEVLAKAATPVRAVRRRIELQ